MPTGSPGHRTYRIDGGSGRVYARCECGWRTAPTMNAGLAGAEWDAHAEPVPAELEAVLS